METNKNKIEKDSVKKIVEEFVSEKVFYSQENSNEMVLRISDAIPIEIPVGLKIVGAIDGPYKFWEKRKNDHNPQKCHVVYDKIEGKISLYINETSAKEGHVITGKVMPNPELIAMFINSNKEFSCKELMEHLKMNRVMFEDRMVNAKIVNQLQMFRVKVVNDKEQSDDYKGNQKNVNNFTLETEFEASFVIKCPIFKGGDVKTFRVEVLVSVTDGDVLYWLESVELRELQTSEKYILLEKQLGNFNELVKIEQ